MSEREKMALLLCPECKREVSTEADNCPGCGFPVKARQADVQTVELTAKKWKKQQAIGAILFLAGCAAACTTQTRGFSFLILAGIIVYGRARYKAWWEHG